MERTTPRRDREPGSFGARTIAFLIDSIVIALAGAVLFGLLSKIDPFLLGSLVPVLGLGVILYFVVFEGLWGQTIGKWAMGISVISSSGDACGITSATVRNLLRVVDGLPAMYLLGGALIWHTDSNQRLGDLLGDTIVVRTRS